MTITTVIHAKLCPTWVRPNPSGGLLNLNMGFCGFMGTISFKKIFYFKMLLCFLPAYAMGPVSPV
jgi:hypothetical protein